MILISLLVVILFIIVYIISYSIRYNSSKKELDTYFDKLKNDETKTPKILIQTYYDKKKIPQKVFDNINKYASNYKHIVYDDNECIEFLSKNYNSMTVKRFKNLKGAFKSDLFRYCWLYKNGGVYMDIKTILIKDIDEIFIDRTKLYTVKSKNNFQIYQGIISTPPNNPIFKKLILLLCLKPDIILKLHYPINTKDFYNNLDYSIDYILFQEYCCDNMNSNLKSDRYNLKCSVNDHNKERLFLTRYSEYPW